MIFVTSKYLTEFVYTALIFEYIAIAFYSFVSDFVTLMLSGGSEAENAKERLKEKMSTIKIIANDYKKMNPEKS